MIAEVVLRWTDDSFEVTGWGLAFVLIVITAIGVARNDK